MKEEISEEFMAEIKKFLGPKFPESGTRKDIEAVLKSIAPSYWDSVGLMHIERGPKREASSLLRALKYGYDPEYGYIPENRGESRG